MSEHARNDESDVKSSTVMARIIAQDELYVAPLREMLHESGCSVQINGRGDNALMYWICVGDIEFVKTILAQPIPSTQKRLCIIYDGDWEPQRGQLNLKIALVDPVPMSDDLVRKLLAFLFTNSGQIMNARKGLGTPPKRSVIPTPSAREPYIPTTKSTGEDESRVASIMKQVFTSTGKNEIRQQMRTTKNNSMHMALRILSIIGILCVPVFIYMISSLLGGILLYMATVSVAAGKTTRANYLLSYSRGYTQSSLAMLEAGSVVFDRLGFSRFAQDQETMLGLMNDAVKSEIGVLHIIDTGRALAVGMLDPGAKTDTSIGLADVISLHGDVTQVSQNLALIQAQLDRLLTSGRFPFSNSRVQLLGHSMLTRVLKVRTMIQMTERLLTLYPEIGGFKNPQTFLVLLQNSMELRPTGGFIGSLLLMTMTDGKLTDLQVQDVYAADGQLKGHVDPPSPIKTMLGIEHWYLRDSNWDPDFAKSAVQAAWFYQKEMGVPVDGVIGISLPLVTRLLEVTGPLELPDFNERISASNFFAKSLLYTQNDFFPGSTQKKDFLGNLTNIVLLHITGDKNVQASKLLDAVTRSLDAKDIQFYIVNPSVQSLISKWQWDGGVSFLPCQPISRAGVCINDGIGLVQANLGVNKVNYFMKQEALSRIRLLEDGTISSEVTITLHNASTENNHNGGGTYQAYMRFLYPKDAELVGVSVDGVALPLSDISHASPSASVMVDYASDAMSVGVPMFVPAKSEHQLTVISRRVGPYRFTPTSTYEYAIRKQAGVEIFPWHVIVEYPQGWYATADVDLAKPGSLQYNTDLSRDGKVRVFFDSSL